MLVQVEICEHITQADYCGDEDEDDDDDTETVH